MKRRRLPVTLCAVLTLLCSGVKPQVTEEDLILLSGDREVPHCFSRNLETVVCYWSAEEVPDEDGDVIYGFYYTYDEGNEMECDITVQSGRRTLYVCEHDELILFNYLNVFVRDKKKNRTLRSRKLELELFVILQHPHDIKVTWEESSERFRVTWIPPEIDMNFRFKYEVQFWFLEEERQSVIRSEVREVLLPQLNPGQLYHVRIRTAWNGEKASIWGPWSKAVTFVSVASAETIGLQCFTPDLSQVCCTWDERILDASFLQVHYRYGQKSTFTWQPCKDSEHRNECHCAFPARNDTSMSMKLNVTFVNGKQRLYYNKPILISHIVRPQVPVLHAQQVPGNKLALNWSSPIPGLRKHLIYQIRFSTDNEKSWTTLQVPAGVYSKEISMVSGTSYILQIRTGPTQEEIQGSWSGWSAKVTTKSPSSTGWVTPVIAVSFLLIVAAGFCLPYIFPSFYRKLKDKLWPPLPNLHRVLDTFMAEIQKQYQPNFTLYEKPQEEAAQPSSLEILCELTPTRDSQQVSRDYVQLAPPSYRNEEYWPNLDPMELTPDLGANELPHGLTNQTYLPTAPSLH
ncbi:thrombopoietin receptor [Hyla sarda]|uniref:thrombopoietin receptor n=1 Tax=Hyla sarda TaxID=327740 RepID=UPI0024C33E9B|nr:thrombopoietin receptor [Hyla sarda]